MSAYRKEDPPVGAQAGVTNEEDESAKAAHLFLERLGLLPGVVRVERGHDRSLKQPSFRIYLRDDDPETEYAVYRLEAEIYQLCPRSYLDVLVLAEAESAEPTDPFLCSTASRAGLLCGTGSQRV